MAQLNDIQNVSTWLIPGITFLIALGGSAHCVGMCGGLVMAFSHDLKSNFTYQLGRLFSYMLLGFLASFLGATFVKTFQSEEVILVSSFFFGGLLIYWGLKILFQKTLKLTPPHFVSSLSKKIYSLSLKFKTRPSFFRSFFMGSLSIFLPCGFLYGVVIILASFANPILGAVAMLSFWIGTVPSLLFAPTILTKVLNPLKNKAPLISSLGLILIGVLTIGFRFFNFYTQSSQHMGHMCH